MTQVSFSILSVPDEGYSKNSWTKTFNLSFTLESEIVVWFAEKSNALLILFEEMDLDCMCAFTQRLLEFFKKLPYDYKYELCNHNYFWL
jgi:hypothetical protein